MYKYTGIVIIAEAPEPMSLKPLIDSHKYYPPAEKIGEGGVVIGAGTYKDTYEHSERVDIVKLNASPKTLKILITPRSSDTADDAVREVTEDLISAELV